MEVLLPSSSLRLQVLGDFELAFDGETHQVSLPGQRLLAYVAVAPAVAPWSTRRLPPSG
jgi:hypothetical protein